MPGASSALAIGRPLPRAVDAYTAPEKLKWILAEHGRGAEWANVFAIGGDESAHLWVAICRAVLNAPISAIRDLGTFGVACEVRALLMLNSRAAPALTAWHYEDAHDAPRLITAYPTP